MIELDALRALLDAARRYDQADDLLQAHPDEDSRHATLYALWGQRHRELKLAIADLSEESEPATDLVTERNRMRAVVDVVRDAFVRHSDEQWCISYGALVVLADVLDALDEHGYGGIDPERNQVNATIERLRAENERLNAQVTELSIRDMSEEGRYHDAIDEHDALVDVAAGAAILLAQIEWTGARPKDISMLKEALDRHQRLRKDPEGVKQPDSPIVIMNDPTHRPIEG